MTKNPIAAAEKYPPPLPYREHDGKPKRRLSRKKQAAARVLTYGEISAVYPEAIEAAGFVSGTAKGTLVLGALIALVGTGFTWRFGLMVFSEGGGYVFAGLLFLLMGTVFLGAAMTFLRIDLFSYRDDPVLFNRKTRKVHVFRRRVQMRKPWARWPLVIDGYDWERITGEIHGGFQLVGGSLPAMRYRLMGAVSDGPTGPGRKTQVIDEFLIGAETSKEMCASRWEHIRRYMEEDGPPLPPGDRLAKVGFSHREALARGGLWLFEPGYFNDYGKHAVSRSLSIVIQLTLSPLLICFSLFQWLAEVTSCAPWWPNEILEAAGGAPLPEAEVHAKADALKRTEDTIEEAKLTDEERQECAYVKAEEAEPFWTPERKKYAVAFGAVAVVLVIGKAVQVWMRGY